MTLSERTAYLKGLMEGMEIDTETKEGKLFAAIIDVLDEMAEGHRLFVTIEDAAVAGGYGDSVMRYVSGQNMGVKVLTMGIPDCFVEHGNIPQLREQIGLDAVSIVEKIEHAWENL